LDAPKKANRLHETGIVDTRKKVFQQKAAREQYFTTKSKKKAYTAKAGDAKPWV
jgi:hypothetical protein